MIEQIENAYRLLEQMNLSVTSLIVAAVVFALALLFAVREAASWFFKVDDVKRDIARLHEISLQLEGEVRLVQNLIAQVQEQSRALKLAQPPPTDSPDVNTLVKPEADSTKSISGAKPAIEPAPFTTANKKATDFPIAH